MSSPLWNFSVSSVPQVELIPCFSSTASEITPFAGIVIICFHIFLTLSTSVTGPIYYSSPLGCIIDTSNSICPNLDTQSFPQKSFPKAPPNAVLTSVDGNFTFSVPLTKNPWNHTLYTMSANPDDSPFKIQASPVIQNRAFLGNLSKLKWCKAKKTITVNLYGNIFKCSQTQKITLRLSWFLRTLHANRCTK